MLFRFCHEGMDDSDTYCEGGRRLYWESQVCSNWKKENNKCANNSLRRRLFFRTFLWVQIKKLIGWFRCLKEMYSSKIALFELTRTPSTSNFGLQLEKSQRTVIQRSNIHQCAKANANMRKSCKSKLKAGNCTPQNLRHMSWPTTRVVVKQKSLNQWNEINSVWSSTSNQAYG